MGNVLSSAIPTEILPVEAYISDVPEMKFVMNLGSTRFMKVARTDHNVDGPLVVKVFVLCDQSFSMEPYRDRVSNLRMTLQSCANCCPFNRVYLINNRCAILSRPYYKDTLYDRMSTRPFIIDPEKKWIAFQLLKALKQLHDAEVCHGDLKSQNVLVSSSHWVQITDFASFKPAFLAMDNPSNFTFFFDTSRRRSCYLAPERFQKTSEVPRLPDDYAGFTEGLTHEMDVYSMACVLIELFTDGKCPFYFGEQLIRYLLCDEKDPSVAQYVTNALEGVPEMVRPLLTVMLAKDPKNRQSWLQEFDKLQGSFFPDFFEDFAYSYFKSFRATKTEIGQPSDGKFLAMEADDTISKISHDFALIWDKLATSAEQCSGMVVLFISLLTSELRALRSLSAKLEAIRLLKKFAEISTTLVVTERILPYLIHKLSDRFVQVRCEAVYVIADLIDSLKECPKEGYRLFADYLFPKLKVTAHDKSAYVRMALAHNLGRFAKSSFRFISDSTSPLIDVETTVEAEDTENETVKATQTLQQAINEIFVVLCTGGNNVRLCLISPHTTSQLCGIFSTTDIETQLSHMITFINDKNDWRLRDTFFSSIWIPTCLVSRQRYEMQPLLEEGLNDSEEFVVLQTLKCIHIFCERGVLDKWALFPMLKDVIRFLAHPNKWLRLAVVNFLVMLDGKLTVADIRCKVTPMVSPYLVKPLIRFDRPTILSESLRPPIPRIVWTTVSQLGLLFEPIFAHLESTQIYVKLNDVQGSLPQSKYTRAHCGYPSKDTHNIVAVDATIQKLRNLGLTDKDMDMKLLAFHDFFKRTCALKRSTADSRPSSAKQATDGVVKLDQFPRVSRKRFNLEKGCSVLPTQTGAQPPSSAPGNADWREMFGNDEDGRSVQPLETGASVAEENPYAASSPAGTATKPVDSRPSTASLCQARWATSKLMLESLFVHKRDIYIKSKRSAATFPNNNDRDAFYIESASAPNLGRTDVRQVAHLHEHMASVTQLAASSDGMHFASASADRTVRIWSTKQIQGDCSVAIRSERNLVHGSKINAVQFLYSRDNHVVSGGDDSRITIFDWRTEQVIRTVNLDKKVDGPITTMSSSDALLYSLTHHGSLHCYDFRMPHAQVIAPRLMPSVLPRWNDRLPNKYGLISSFAIDPVNNHWMALTSTTRHILLWDIRFGLEVASWSHMIRPRSEVPTKRACRMIKCWANTRPGCDSQLFTSSEFNGEVSLWNMHTQDRAEVLWCHKEKPLKYTADTNHQTTALAICPLSHGVYTGDSYGALRYWDLGNTVSCAYLSGPARKSLQGEFASDNRRAVYDNTYVEGIKVTYEKLMVTKNPDGKLDQTAVSPHVGEYHRDAVTDIVCLAGTLFASADRNGIIKVWKRFNERV